MTSNRLLRALAWLAPLAAAACTDSPEIILRIDSTAGVPCEIDSIHIIAKSSDTTTIVKDVSGGLPISVTLIDGTSNHMVDLQILGFKGNAEVLRVAGTLPFTGKQSTTSLLLDLKCTPSASCTLAEAVAAAAAPASARSQCGPNVTHYTEGSALEGFQNACMAQGFARTKLAGTMGPYELTDLEGAPLSAFNFSFYGRPVHKIWVDRNGYISFSEDNPDPTDSLIPGSFDRNILGGGSQAPEQSVMVFWDGVILSQEVCYVISGQQLLISWVHACLTAGSNPVTMPCVSDEDLNFTIALNADSQSVELTYGTMTAENADRAQGLTATVGIVDLATGCPVDQCSLATGLCKNGTPCGYSEVFSSTKQVGGLQNVQFTPIDN